jgi:hypothetical protein
MYTEVLLSLPVPHRAYEIPATALYNDASGLRVAVVDADESLRFAKIVIERDTGATLQVSNGLTADDRVVRLASASFRAGNHVKVRQPQASAAAPPAK